MSDKLDYLEVRELIIEDYDEFIELDDFSPEQSIAATLEGSIRLMRSSKKFYICVVITLAILSLKQGFIPDYLLICLDVVNFKGIEGLSDEEQSAFREDMDSLEKLLGMEDYKIDKDEIYKARVKMLLGLFE
ncbi:MAG: hypothetical protein FWC69_00945 [Defluviitaleaceae bacterium]|nr:hypothetical protein [Defluviitaleaceae bacterium]